MEAFLEEGTVLSVVERMHFSNWICDADWAHVADYGTHNSAGPVSDVLALKGCQAAF